MQNDFGNSITNDQKTYTITGQRPNVNPIIINLFLKFSEFDEIPYLKEIKINGHHVCLPDTSNEEIRTEKAYSMMPPAFNRSMDNMFVLTDLPFNSFPNVSLSPLKVNNVSLIQLFF